MADRSNRSGRNPSYSVKQRYTDNGAIGTRNAPESSDDRQELRGSGRSADDLPSANPVSGGALLPTLNSRVLTQSEVKDLKKYTLEIEEEILRHEDTCRVCRQHFEFDSDDVSRLFCCNVSC